MSGQTVILRSEAARDLACSFVLRAPTGAVVNIRLATRTGEQNDKLWAMLSDVSRAKPQGRDYPPEIWKSLFMADVGFEPRFEPSLSGRGVVPIGYKSSRLTKGEFSDLIECIAAYAAEHNIALGGD